MHSGDAWRTPLFEKDTSIDEKFVFDGEQNTRIDEKIDIDGEHRLSERVSLMRDLASTEAPRDRFTGISHYMYSR